MRPARIKLHIDLLVLDGVDPGDRAAIDRALRAELADLLGRGLSTQFEQSAHIARLEGGRVSTLDGGAELGRGVARAVHRGLSTREARVSKEVLHD